MDLSGVIFVLLAVAWAVFLIPKSLKRRDEVARTRSIDRFSSAMRVLARREPVNRSDSRLVVTAPSGTARVTVPALGETVGSARADTVAPPVSAEPSAAANRLEARRTAARVAARRRRRILTVLLLSVALTAVAAYLGYGAWWSVAVPGGLSLVYLVLCRRQVRRERARDGALRKRRSPPAGAVEEVSGREAVASVGDAAAEVVEVASPVAYEAAVVPTADPPAAQGASAEGASAEETTADEGTLWDPLPVTLPTYVTKPRARRTVRTIDLGEPGTWTSGRTAEDADIAARAAGPKSEQGQATEPGRRAAST